MSKKPKVGRRDNMARALDKANAALRDLHRVIGWILHHWDHFPTNLYELRDDEFIPYDIREFLVELARQDTANALTIVMNWRVFDEEDERDD